MTREYNVRDKDGNVIDISTVDRCCGSCKHIGFAPDGCAPCFALFEYYGDEPNIRIATKEQTHPYMALNDVCVLWESNKETDQ